MYGKVSEKIAHRVRLIVVLLLFLSIGFLLYGQETIFFHIPRWPLNLLNIESGNCIAIENSCTISLSSSTRIHVFWSTIPLCILSLLIFGHEFWRRICPISFLSQLPKALNSQKRVRRVSHTGKVYFEIPKISKSSWLRKYHLYFQLGLLFIGLIFRILLLNSNSTALGIWLLLVTLAAVGIGYSFDGKTWCNYFCPMSPVQEIYSEPQSLLGSKSHTLPSGIPQSMCRETTSDRQEESTCIGCKAHCIDIDAERAYWTNLGKPERKVLYYGYLGMMIGYFIGNYIYSSPWLNQTLDIWNNSIQFVHVIHPLLSAVLIRHTLLKTVAVPLILAICTSISIVLGLVFESVYRNIRFRKISFDRDTQQHEINSIVTFICFNVYATFISRSALDLINSSVVYMIEAALILLSGILLIKTWKRSKGIYFQEKLSSRIQQARPRDKSIPRKVFDDKNLELISRVSPKVSASLSQKR